MRNRSTNLDIRAYAMRHGFSLSEVAKYMGIPNSTFSVRYMFNELSREDKKTLYKVIDRMVEDERQRIQNA